LLDGGLVLRVLGVWPVGLDDSGNLVDDGVETLRGNEPGEVAGKAKMVSNRIFNIL
jgi:hypothetical protein